MANHIELPNNCRASYPAVYPKNWETCKPSALEEKWYIWYRFYDDNLGKNMKVIIRSFNHIHTLVGRRQEISAELTALVGHLQRGFNPFNRKKLPKNAAPKHPANVLNAPSERMSFENAIKFADSKIVVSVAARKSEVDWYIGKILKFAAELKLLNVAICEITRKDLRLIIDKCALKDDGTFSEDKFNRCRKMLTRLYSEFIEYDIVESNIAENIQRKERTVETIRETLQDDQREQIDEYLKLYFPAFRNYMHIFYHSGARSAELLRLKVSDVDLKNLRIKYVILKGKKRKEIFRPIPKIAVKYWQEVIGDAPGDHYVFSKGLVPGEEAIQPYQIHKRYYRLIKAAKKPNGQLRFPNIKATFYSLKHSKVSDLADEVGLDVASHQFGEDVKTLKKHYDTRGKSRHNNKLVEAGKEFVK